MKTLEIEKIWTGDGFGQNEAITLRQIKRTDTVAMYERITKSNLSQGFEVFVVRVVEAGTPLPGNVTVQESYEQYPSANRFGKTAWCVQNLQKADALFEKLANTVLVVEAKEVSLDLPNGEFTTNELAEQNGVDYLIATKFIKDACTSNRVRFVREERRNAKGKASKIYATLS